MNRLPPSTRRPRQGLRSRIASILIPLIASVATVAAVEARDEAAPDVLIITIDTLRADRMSAYGYDRQTSPNLD